MQRLAGDRFAEIEGAKSPTRMSAMIVGCLGIMKTVLCGNRIVLAGGDLAGKALPFYSYHV